MKDFSRKVAPKMASKSQPIPQFPKANGSGAYQAKGQATSLKPKPSKIPQFGKNAGYLGHSLDKNADPTPKGRKSKEIPQFSGKGKGMIGSRGSTK